MKSPKLPYHHGNLRDAVLQAAQRALETVGPQELSLREISRELGVSHTAPRRHFLSKQDLLDALAIHGFDELRKALAHATAGPSLTFDQRLSRSARAVVHFAVRHPALLGHMFAAKHQAHPPPALIEASEQALASGPQLIREGQAAGLVIPGDPEMLALVVFAEVQGLIAIADRGRIHGVPIADLVDEFIGHVILGLRPRN